MDIPGLGGLGNLGAAGGDKALVAGVVKALNTDLPDLHFDSQDGKTVKAQLRLEQAENFKAVQKKLTKDDKEQMFGRLDYNVNEKSELVVSNITGQGMMDSAKITYDMLRNKDRGPGLKAALATGDIDQVREAAHLKAPEKSAQPSTAPSQPAASASDAPASAASAPAKEESFMQRKMREAKEKFQGAKDSVSGGRSVQGPASSASQPTPGASEPDLAPTPQR